MPKSLEKKTVFTIRHYAGDVRYSMHGMLEKNKDSLYRDLQYLMGASQNAYLASLFPATARREAFWREACNEGRTCLPSPSHAPRVPTPAPSLFGRRATRASPSGHRPQGRSSAGR